MTPEIKAAIEKESNEHEARCWRMEPWVDITHEKSFTAGAEYGYKLGLLLGKIGMSNQPWLVEIYKKELQELLNEK